MYCSTDLFPHIDAPRCSNKAQEIFTDRCVLDFVILPQGLKLSWIQEFTYLWWQCGVFRRAQSFESFRTNALLCRRVTLAKTHLFLSVSFDKVPWEEDRHESSIVSFTICNTGAIYIDSYSEGNFIGNVSFEGNCANISGGKGKLEDALPAIPT